MMKNLEFKRGNNESQSDLRNDIRQIHESNNLFVSADKSRNMYKVKCNTNKSNSINFKAKQIASKLEIDD